MSENMDPWVKKLNERYDEFYENYQEPPELSEEELLKDFENMTLSDKEAQRRLKDIHERKVHGIGIVYKDENGRYQVYGR